MKKKIVSSKVAIKKVCVDNIKKLCDRNNDKSI